MKLRDYQENAVQSVLSEWQAGNTKTLVVQPTGTGKTVTFSEVVRRQVQTTGKRAMVIAHREELIYQAAKKLRTITGIDPGIEMADQRAHGVGFWDHPMIVCASKDTLRGRRLEKFAASDFGCLVIDEAHHSTAKSYSNIISHFKGVPLLGVTATPDRHDEIALGNVFQSVAFDYGLADAIRDGWLVRVRQDQITVADLDLSNVRVTAGDLNAAELSAVLEHEKVLHEMVYPTIDIVGDRRTLIFCASVHQAERVAEIIDRHRPGSARSVSGTTPSDERARIFKDFGNGEFQFLVNVGIATEGWDDPATDGRGVQCVALMRMTQSRSLYAQMLGRGTRPLPGVVDGDFTAEERVARIAASKKPSMLVLDYKGNAGRHQLVYASDILGGKALDEVVSKVKEKSGSFDVLEEIDIAEVEYQRKLEAARRARVIGTAQYERVTVDPFAHLGIAPKRVAWWFAQKPASDAQKALLRKNGVPGVDRINMGEAKQLIDKVMGSPSEKQAKVLRRFGYDPAKYDRKGASQIIDAVVANGWKRPVEVAQ